MQVSDLGSALRSAAELAQMVGQVAEAVQATAIICVSDNGTLAQELQTLSLPARLVAVTANDEAHAALAAVGLESLHLPLYAADKYSQVRHVLTVTAREGKISAADYILCVLRGRVYREEGDLIVLTGVDPGIDRLLVIDLLEHTDGIRPDVMEATLALASRIGRIVQRGSARIGAIFILGDSAAVLKGSKQLVPNPFYGHGDQLRQIGNRDIHDALIEFSKLDGAFVVRGDGFIESAGVFLETSDAGLRLPVGLGARHIAAAAVTAVTAAIAVVVSATDGNVRAFSNGGMVLQMDPNLPYGSAVLRE